MAVQISGNDITVPRDGSFTRNVTIGGTLTYEDVTNIDSVGLVTARNGIEIGTRPGIAASISVDGNMIVSGISTFGGAANFAAISGTTGTFTGDLTIPDKIIHSGDTNTAIRFPTGDAISAETGGSEALRIDSSQRLLLGNTSSQTVYTAAKVQIQGTDGNSSSLSLLRHGNSPYMILGSSGGSSLGDVTALSDGDRIGQVTFAGADGSDIATHAASIAAYVDGSVGSNSVPARISFQFGTSETEKVRIDTSGRVIIGDSMSSVSSQSNLQVRQDGSGANLELVRSYNSASTPARLRFANSRGTAGSPLIVADDDTIGEIRFHAYDGTDYAPIAASIFAVVDGTPGTNDMPGRLEFHTTPDGNQTTVERMRIDASGQVNIGAASPTASENGQLNVYITTSSGKAQIVHSAGTGGLRLAGTGGGSGSNLVFSNNYTSGTFSDHWTITHNGGDDSLRIIEGGTGGSERLRVVGGGRLFLGCTGAINMNGVTTGHTIQQVDEYKWTVGLRVEQTNKVGLAIRYAAGGNDHDVLLFAKDTTVKFVVHGTGNVSNANNSYGQTSDVSLKENIVDANSQWNDIKNVKVRNFNFKAETGLSSHTQIGVVAQEIETTSPKLVTENEQGIKEVGYSVLYMKAIKALQEAQTRIETLESRLDAAGL